MIAVLFATTMEAEPFLLVLERAAPKTTLTPELFQFEIGETPLLVAIVGMGKTAAAASTIALLETYTPETAINIGIAGALSNRVDVGGIYRVSHAVDGSRPENAFACHSLAFSDLPARALVTSEKPVFDETLRQALAQHGDMVDMEGAVIAAACTARGIPCAQLKGISDTAGDGDRETLRKNLAVVSEKLAEKLAPRIWGL